MSEKPFSQSCENNKLPILQQLTRLFSESERVLEVGSGTGQHAVFFAQNLPHLFWQTSDQPHYHQGIQAWLEDAQLSNTGAPIPLAFPTDNLPLDEYDALFSANTAHIMQKEAVKSLMGWASKLLPAKGVFCQYGPFTQHGEFSSESNRNFHEYLLEDGCGGYRDIEELKVWAGSLNLEEIIEMPANNLLLVWRKA